MDLCYEWKIEGEKVNEIKQAYINSEILDIDETDPVIIFTAGYEAGSEQWKKNYKKLYEFIVARDMVKQWLKKENE